MNMKAHYILFAVAALVVSAACTKTNEQPEPEGIQMTFRAYQEGAQETKTTVQDGGTQVYWEPADEIKVFFKSSSGRFVSQNNEQATVTDFSGTLNILIGANEGAGSTTKIFGLYPYRADAVSDGSSVTTTLPATQTGRAGSFAKNTHISLAATNANSVDLGFYNVTGGLRFSLTQEGIKSVTFEGNNGESLAGKIKLAFEGCLPAIKEVSEGENVITLRAPGGGTFQTGQWYYIEAIPGTLSKGFKMVFSKGNESAKLSSSSSVTIGRGKYGSLADADEDLIFKENGGDEPDPSSVIQFADPIAKYACVEKFDTDHDGEVSYAEAAAATSLKGLFTNWNTVTRFDEIKYFTSVTSIQGVFNGLPKLESIVIPDSITTLGTFQNCTSLKSVTLPSSLASLPEYCFDGCVALTSVTLPDAIPTIPNYCFRYCASLQSVSIPSTVTSITHYAFSGCSVLKNIELPSVLETIGSSAFSGCSGLTSVAFPSSLTSIGSYAFYGSGLTSVSVSNALVGQFTFSDCTSLTSVTLPSSMAAIPSGLFSGCTSLRTITWPSALETIGSSAFYGCSFEDADYTIELPATVKTIESGAFGNVRHLIIPSSSAVSISNDSFKKFYTYLYVPAGMIEMYKARTNWIGYSDYIRPIVEYPSSPTSKGTVGDAVDLGLSVKWASWNIGATRPEEIGDYYSWGETELKWDYNWSTYKWCNGNWDNLTKYCPENQTDYWGGSSSPDNKTVLDLEDDAAIVNWGGSWRMPTDADWTELINNCTWTWTSDYNGTDIKGWIVTSNKTDYTNKSIFLPAAGSRDDTNLEGIGAVGYYWSSSLSTDYPNCAWIVYFHSFKVFRQYTVRWHGISIRPVCPKD